MTSPATPPPTPQPTQPRSIPLMTGADFRESLRRAQPRVFVDGRRV